MSDELAPAKGQDGTGLYWNDPLDEEALEAMGASLQLCPNCNHAFFYVSVPYWYVQCCGKITQGFDFPESAIEEWNQKTVNHSCNPDSDI